MIDPVPSPYLVPFDGSFRMAQAPTAPSTSTPAGKKATKALKEERLALAELQRMLWADRSRSLLLILQARDAAGKDSTIRHVLRGVNPAGVRVTSFRAPTRDEVEHDFLWRGARALPGRGTIGVHNRSWYEEVLVVRVHPGFLRGQHVALPDDPMALWSERYESIRDYERHLARNGTAVVKCFLNVSAEEQRRRLLSRLDEAHKHWKFNPGDLEERALWGAYDRAYEDALNHTSRPWAPWYAVPADDKPHMRLTVCRLLIDTLKAMEPEWPEPDPDDVAGFEASRQQLLAEG